jgi:hypothetical protein
MFKNTRHVRWGVSLYARLLTFLPASIVGLLMISGSFRRTIHLYLIRALPSTEGSSHTLQVKSFFFISYFTGHVTHIEGYYEERR